MRTRSFVRLFAPVLAMSLATLAFGGQPRQKDSIKAPSIEGTYKLVSRKLPDGTVVKPPDVMGLQTFTKNYRNFNVIWHDANGKHFAFSVASTYKLTATEYTETMLFSIMKDEIGGKEDVYSMSSQTKSAPVKMADGRIEFKLPFDPPSAVFEGNKITATAEGLFTDYWERVK